MSGLREQIEALRDDGEQVAEDAVFDASARSYNVGKAAALAEVLALLDQQPPKRWSAEVEAHPQAAPGTTMRRVVFGVNGRRMATTGWVPVADARSLAAQIDGEA